MICEYYYKVILNTNQQQQIIEDLKDFINSIRLLLMWKDWN